MGAVAGPGGIRRSGPIFPVLGSVSTRLAAGNLLLVTRIVRRPGQALPPPQAIDLGTTSSL
jgi:hypothetical protein